MAPLNPPFAGKVRSAVGNGGSVAVALHQLLARCRRRREHKAAAASSTSAAGAAGQPSHPGADLAAADHAERVGGRLAINDTDSPNPALDGRTCLHDRLELLLAPTIAVVATTIVIYALKTFDVVYTMTNGNFNTNVIANVMFQELFNNGQAGRAAAIAVILFAAIVPVMWINIRRFREQEALR